MAQPLQHQHRGISDLLEPMPWINLWPERKPAKQPCPCGPEGCECSDPGAAHEPIEAEAELARTLAALADVPPV